MKIEKGQRSYRVRYPVNQAINIALKKIGRKRRKEMKEIADKEDKSNREEEKKDGKANLQYLKND